MSRPLALPPERLLRTLSDAIGDFTPVGSFARDYLVHDVAGLPRGAQTLDVDIAILVASMTDYRARLRQLDGPRGSGLTFQVEGVAVDVIPYGTELATTGIIEPIPGVALDVTGRGALQHQPPDPAIALDPHRPVPDRPIRGATAST